jgi:hypothetical protein
MASDSRTKAIASSGYLPDPRSEHYWDLWNFATKLYTEQLRFPAGEIAWDMLVMYKPHLVWKTGPPEPTLFMQNRGLDIGVKLDPAVLKAELQKWTQ